MPSWDALVIAAAPRYTLGTDRMENTSPNSSSIVALCEHCSDSVDNTIPVLLFMAIT
jgi:hypothetical protein